MQKNPLLWLPITISILFLASCGDGGSSVTAQGTFLDSAVGGMRYVSGGLSGYTDSSGGFKYKKGKTVSFYIGDILIGQTNGKPIVTPVDLAIGARNETDPTVSNICQFLQSLDDDGNPSNGITITTQEDQLAAGMTVNFTQSITSFAGDGNVASIVSTLTSTTTAGARMMISATTAQNNLQTTLLGLIAGQWSGTYTGTNSGDDSGTWTLTIDNTGYFTGSTTSLVYSGTYSVMPSRLGNVTSDGSITFFSGTGIIQGATTYGNLATYTGTFDGTIDTVTGTWDGYAGSGTWSGYKQ